MEIPCGDYIVASAIVCPKLLKCNRAWMEWSVHFVALLEH